ncbi:MAG: hypothetical protein RSD13_04760 [Clostridium sp.]
MPITVGPGLLPILADGPIAGVNSSSKVSFSVAVPQLAAQTNLLITLCITIKIGSVVVSIYYSKILLSNTASPTTFEVLLPNNAVINDAEAFYDAVYSEVIA